MGILGETSVKIRADTSSFHSEASAGVLGSVTKVAAAAVGIFGGIQLGKGLFNATIKSAADFQTTLKVLQAVTGTTNANLSRLSAQAIKLGADVHLPATSAAQAADAMLQLGKAGFNTNQIIAASHGVLLLSTAAEVDNATAADMVTKALGAFGLQAKDAGTVVNDFAGAANASQSSLQDVGDAMTQAAAGFHALRVPVGDAATAIAEMAKQGITGGMAGATLNTALVHLAAPTTKAKQLMSDLGIQLFDSNGKFVGMRDAIAQMSPKLDDMSNKQRLATLTILGGQRGMKALSDVLGVGTASWDKTKAAVERAGQAQQIANAKTSGFNGAVLALKNTLGTMALQIGIAVLPKVTQLVGWLGKLAAAPSFSVAIKIAWDGIKGFAEDVSKQVGDALFGSSRVVHIGGHSTGVVVDPGLIAGMTEAISKAFDAVNWDTIALKITRGIGDATAKKAQNGDSDSAASYANTAKGVASQLLNQINLQMEEFSRGVGELFGRALSAGVGYLLSATPGDIGAGLKQVAVLAVKIMVDSLSLAAAPMVGLIEGILGKNFVGTTRQVIASLPGELAGLAGNLASAGAKVVTDFAGGITSKIQAIPKAITGVAGSAVGAAEKLASDIAAKIKDAPGKIGLAGLLASAVTAPLALLSGTARGEAEKVATAIAGGIKTAAEKLTGLAGDVIGKIRGAMSEALGAAATAAFSVGIAIMQGIESGLDSGWSAVASTAEHYAKKAVSIMTLGIESGSPSKLSARTVGLPIMQGIGVGLDQGLPDVIAKADLGIAKIAAQFANVTKANAPTIAKAFDGWAKDAKAAFDQGVSTLSTSLSAQLTKAKAAIDHWKAQLTPAEVYLNTTKAKEELDSLTGAVNDAWAALAKLPAQQAADMAALLAQQKQTMDQMKATQADTQTSTALAQHAVDVDNQTTDPLAQQLVQAQMNLTAAKKAYAEGTESQAALFAAQDAFDAATLAAQDDTLAQKELSDYNAWQDLLTQAGAGQQAIADQAAADAAAQLALQAQQQADSSAAWTTYYAARQSLGDSFLEQQATASRTAKDAEAKTLDDNLTAQYKRIQTALKNQKTAWDTHYTDLAGMATTSGKNIISNLADALDKASDPGQPLESSLKKVAELIKKYLKTNSPTELGPMSDLNTWWKNLAPTLISSLDTSMIKGALADAVTPGAIGAGASRPGAASAMKWDNGDVVKRLDELIDLAKSGSGPAPAAVTPISIINKGGVTSAVYKATR